MSANVQAKLLRALEDRRIERLGGDESIPVDVRIVSATHRAPEEEIEKGGFRADLFYRLRVVTIDIAPLRERREDIPMLAAAFARQAHERHHLPERALSREALRQLMNYSWPGNVRELKNVIERAAIISEGDELDAIEVNGRAQKGSAAAVAGKTACRANARPRAPAWRRRNGGRRRSFPRSAVAGRTATGCP